MTSTLVGGSTALTPVNMDTHAVTRPSTTTAASASTSATTIATIPATTTAADHQSTFLAKKTAVLFALSRIAVASDGKNKAGNGVVVEAAAEGEGTKAGEEGWHSSRQRGCQEDKYP